MSAPTTAEWLAEKSKSYFRDAQAIEWTPSVAADLAENTGLTAEQWAIVYRAVASELRKCAADVTGVGALTDPIWEGRP